MTLYRFLPDLIRVLGFKLNNNINVKSVLPNRYTHHFDKSTSKSVSVELHYKKAS